MEYSPNRLLARLSLLCLVLGTAVGFSYPLTNRLVQTKRRHHTLLLSKHNDCDDMYLPQTAVHSYAIGAATVASSVSTEIAQAVDLFQPYSTVRDTISSDPVYDSSTLSSVQFIAAASTTPMGELPEDSGINPMLSTFGQWFFLIYVVVSLLAGAKEIFGRIAKQFFDKDN